MYRWIITDCKIDNEINGVAGPRRYDETITNNCSKFELYEGRVLVASGFIYGDYQGFEPLDDYGFSLGCCSIKINGEWL